MRWLWLALAVTAADLGSKELAESMLGDGRVPLLPGLNLALAYNTGMAFGMLQDDKWRLLLLLLPLPVCGVLLYWLHTATSTLSRAAIALIIGGALGNLYERLMFGKVTDFIDVYVGQWHWPTFNVADSAITVGAVILCFCFYLEDSAKAGGKAAKGGPD